MLPKRLLSVMAVAALVSTVLMLPTAARADLPDPHVYLDYSTLDFVFTRTAGDDAFGIVGTYSIDDVLGTTLDAILRDGTATEIDRATILSYTDFDVTLSGNVDRIAANVYSLTGEFTATDDTDVTKVLADFASVEVSNDPVTFTNVFVIAGTLWTFGGGEGPILVPAADSWSFFGHLDDTEGSLDVGDDDTITVPGGAMSYDIGDLIDFTLGNDIPDLDTLFASSRALGGGDMKVTVIPAPGAVVLGVIGLGLVGWIRRRFG